jgi:hypothetical protein
MKKKYVHIKEFYLTKLILDLLEVDLEDNGRLYHESLPMKYKNKFLTLVGYKEFAKFDDKELLPLRPFTNQNHAEYLINMFSALKNCDTLFEYRATEDDDDKLKGIMKLSYKHKNITLEFFGPKNLAPLMGGILLKMLSSNSFHKSIKDILKVDMKLSESKKE